MFLRKAQPDRDPYSNISSDERYENMDDALSGNFIEFNAALGIYSRSRLPRMNRKLRNEKINNVISLIEQAKKSLDDFEDNVIGGGIKEYVSNRLHKSLFGRDKNETEEEKDLRNEKIQKYYEKVEKSFPMIVAANMSNKAIELEKLPENKIYPEEYEFIVMAINYLNEFKKLFSDSNELKSAKFLLREASNLIKETINEVDNNMSERMNKINNLFSRYLRKTADSTDPGSFLQEAEAKIKSIRDKFITTSQNILQHFDRRNTNETIEQIKMMLSWKDGFKSEKDFYDTLEEEMELLDISVDRYMKIIEENDNSMAEALAHITNIADYAHFVDLTKPGYLRAKFDEMDEETEDQS